MARRSKTWWGAEFLQALESCMEEGRLRRGRSYAAEHRRRDFKIRQGTVTATMVGNVNPYFGVYKTPYYKVKIDFKKVAASKWNGVLQRIGSNAEWVTHLILGEVPPTIDRAFEGLAVGLLPRDRKDLKSSCSCPDWANPCKHVAGVYYHLAALLDRDPLLLFELRGMARTKLMRAVEQSEFGAALGGDTSSGDPDLASCVAPTRFPVMELGEIETPPADLRSFWRGRPLPRGAGLGQQDPPVSALLLRREGDYPAFWDRENSFLEAMAEVYERVAKSLPANLGDISPDRRF